MRTFEVGMNRKAQFLKKRRKSCLSASDALVGCFCKGWGESAKQRWGKNARWGRFAKGGYESQRVRYKRKGLPAGGVETQKDEPKPVLMRCQYSYLYKRLRLNL